MPEKPTSTRVVSIEPASRRAATESFILRGGVLPDQTNLDPFVPEVLEEPYAVYAELRRRGVYQLPDTPMFIMTRFRDVEYVLMHPELFSVHGLTLRLAEGNNDFRYAINPVIRGLKELHIECDP